MAKTKSAPLKKRPAALKRPAATTPRRGCSSDDLDGFARALKPWVTLSDISQLQQKNQHDWNSKCAISPNFKSQHWVDPFIFVPSSIAYNFVHQATRYPVIRWKFEVMENIPWPSQDHSELHHLHQWPGDQAQGCFADAGVLGTLKAVSGRAPHLELLFETYPVCFGSSEQGHEVSEKKLQ